MIGRHLVGCGYASSLLRTDFHFGSRHVVPLAAFANPPTDARSACIAVIDDRKDTAEAVSACKDLGAPIVFVRRHDDLQWWKQAVGGAEHLETIPYEKLARFFEDQREDLSPHSVYRAKTRARFEPSTQLSFVDVGLMPLVEGETGGKVAGLVERVVQKLRSALWPDPAAMTEDQGRWLLKSVFWLLAGKILHDKGVSGFSSLDLLNVGDLFSRVGKHYGATSDIPLSAGKQRDAIAQAAGTIKEFAHLGHVTTESLAHVYERALITKKTRREFGTHSTPPYLVDYIVWQLAPWIEEIPEEQRHVFEPACGHAAFLVAVMRMLRELLPNGMQARRRRYLRQRLHGCDRDLFALELARLSLTLADVPNPNGWDLQPGDMFARDLLADCAARSMILLANPPFRRFSADEKKNYAEQENEPRYQNKAAEMLGRTLPHLPPGGVFGVVVPQGLLHSRNARDLRSLLAESYEIQEICLFPDKIFAHSGAESAIILGRRVRARRAKTAIVRYGRVREQDVERFKNSYAVTAENRVPQARFSAENEWNMRVPDMEPVWDYLKGNPRLQELADIGEGLSHKKMVPGKVVRCARWFPGAVKGFGRLGRDLQIHSQPEELWMSIDPEAVSTARRGGTAGTPQVLLNHACAGRGPWRIRGFIDRAGRAFNTNYNVLRRKTREIPLEYLWALINSPLSNAYVYAHSTKRHILPGTLKEMPVPDAPAEDIRLIAGTVRSYLRAAARSSRPNWGEKGRGEAHRLLTRVDAEVLRLYDLPSRMEREILDLFAGRKRPGVPFDFDGYFPEDYQPCFPLHEYLSQEYQRSTAGKLRARHRTVKSPDLLAAMDRAIEDFRD